VTSSASRTETLPNKRVAKLMSSEKHERLVRLARAGDPDAFIALFDEERPRLVAYIERHCPARVTMLYELEDILQDVLFEAFRRISQFVGTQEDALFQWLVTISRNRMLALLRTEQSTKRGGQTRRVSPTDSDLESLLETFALHRRTPSRSAASHESMSHHACAGTHPKNSKAHTMPCKIEPQVSSGNAIAKG
jgi:DNA-directed RNA polymerase specialized sigma24 family protein